MGGAGIIEIGASAVGFAIICYAVSAVGRALRDALERAFGAQMRVQFGEEPRVPVLDPVQPLRDRAAL